MVYVCQTFSYFNVYSSVNFSHHFSRPIKITITASVILTILNIFAIKKASSLVRVPLLIAQAAMVVSHVRLFRAMGTEGEGSVLLECQRVNRFAVVNLFVSGYVGTWLHEQGHALAMRACLQGVAPETRVEFFGSGYTYPMGAGAPTRLGERLGERRGLLLIAAAGVVASTVSAAVATIAAKLFQPSRFADVLYAFAFWQVLREGLHAVAGGTDFVEIQRHGGPSRLAIAVMMVVLPILSGAITSLFYPSTRSL